MLGMNVKVRLVGAAGVPDGTQYLSCVHHFNDVHGVPITAPGP